MNNEEFMNEFNHLVMAFSPSKPDDKAKIYYDKLKNQNYTHFKRAVDKALSESERFPTIAKLFELMSSVAPYRGPQAQECEQCNGFGFVSLYGHSFRARCSHGERLNKQIQQAPASDWERKHTYDQLNDEYKLLYGKTLIKAYRIRNEDLPSAYQSSDVQEL